MTRAHALAAIYLAAAATVSLAQSKPAAECGEVVTTRYAFNRGAAARGEALFRTKAQCAVCHVPPLFTEPGWNMHRGEEIGIDDFQADRAPDGRYRTSPL